MQMMRYLNHMFLLRKCVNRNKKVKFGSLEIKCVLFQNVKAIEHKNILSSFINQSNIMYETEQINHNIYTHALI